MELYKRIRKRREELGMSQEELAKKMGYKSRSSINKIEMGENDIPQSKISSFAKILLVNEAWLMGYDTPMERDAYEDQNIITFDAILGKVMNIFENSKYKISLSDDFDHDIIIKDPQHKILACMNDFDLVARYESLRKAGKEITAEALLKNCTNDFTSIEKKIIKKYRTLDPHGKDMVNTVLNKEVERMAELESEPSSTPTQIRAISYYQRLASAGTGQIVFDGVPVDKIEIPDIPEYKRVSYAIGVNGNSMEPLYHDGDILLIEPTCKVDIGEIGIFIIGDESYVKKLGKGKLISLNAGYGDIPLTEYSKCMGRVIDKISKYPELSDEDADALREGMIAALAQQKKA